MQAPAFVDKVVQHALVDNILYDAITRSFIQDSHASQVWKGMHVGLDRLRAQMREYFQKRKGHDETARRAAGLPFRPREQWDYADGWILKADVHHFFASIDHDILKQKLRRRVADGDTYTLRQKIAAQVSEIVGLQLEARKPIRHPQNEQAKKLIQKMRREGKIKPAPPAEPPEGFPW